eukprot:TRINITY_DN3079_c0_g1_i1.p1 TRINITY_DN3079_c0_g1~~TRINITY_DN3079_c0_g1_i1.p1  ORF type:complete len:272 (-),score=49.06 TRINITY_DN3079_c0_g1_i1:689-1504(-)
MAGFQQIQAVRGPYRAGTAGGHGGFVGGAPLHFGDTTLTKIFVGGLAWETQSETMRKYFEQFGEILEAVVITDKNTGRSKGYGFVTFRDPEAARRACADPTPIIDGRRANCNLASLGRPRPAQSSYGRMHPGSSYVGSGHGGQPYVGSPTYHQPIPLPYQQSFVYPPYGYTTFPTEYTYPQNVYNPYAGAPYPQIYGSLGTVGPMYPFPHIGQHLQSGPGYASLQSYGVPAHPLMQFATPGASTVTAISQPYGGPMPTIQGPFPSAGTFLI